MGEIYKIKGIVSLYKGHMLLYLKSTAKRDEYGRHARASASGIDHAISWLIDRSQHTYDGG